MYALCNIEISTNSKLAETKLLETKSQQLRQGLVTNSSDIVTLPGYSPHR